MAQRVAGELYERITGQLFEIGRQLRQSNGYPFNPVRLKQHLQNAIEGKFSTNAIRTCFSIISEELCEALQLIALGNYGWTHPLITDLVTNKQLLKRHEPLNREIELVSFAYKPTYEEVLAEFWRRGLKRPTYGDALHFGIQHPEEQRKHPIVFLHEPFKCSGSAVVLVLGEDGGHERYLSLYAFKYAWDQNFVFAAVHASN